MPPKKNTKAAQAKAESNAPVAEETKPKTETPAPEPVVQKQPEIKTSASKEPEKALVTEAPKESATKTVSVTSAAKV